MRRAILYGVLFAAVAITLVATRTWWLPPKPLEVVVSEQSPYWLPFYLAREEGYFRREGLDVRVVVAASREDLVTALNKEPVVALAEPDVLLTSPSPPVMFARVARLDPTFLLGREQKDQPFRWSDLQGRTIVGYPPGSEEQAVLETVLKKEGVRAQYEVTVLENIPSVLRVPAFVAGTGRYLQAAEPAAALLERQQQGKVLAFPGAVAGDLPAGVFLASPAMVRDHPRELAAFTRAVYRSLLWLQHNQAATATSDAAKYLPGVDPAVVAAALARYQAAKVWSDSPVISQDSYQNWVRMMVEAGELARPAPFDQVVDPAPAQQAVQKVHYGPSYKHWIWPVLNS
ncbi:MAG TPA: ABC transporter substrate-binding protein [Spirochaetia bacterium]|nr:ABC transporter substrate-binding protein [Spirochaetia bacterium]